jgi:hypothetical protein
MAVHGCACPQSGSKATLYQKYLKRKKWLLALFTFFYLIGIFTSLSNCGSVPLSNQQFGKIKRQPPNMKKTT